MKKIVHQARTLIKAVKEVQGMFFCQKEVFTDHKNLTQDDLGLTSDSVDR